MLHCNDEMKVKDRRRDRIWEGMGLTVLRFSDGEVFKDIGAVMEKILKKLNLFGFCNLIIGDYLVIGIS